MPSGKVVTGGADCHVAVLDPRRGYQVVERIPVGDIVYSLAGVGGFMLFISVWAILNNDVVFCCSQEAVASVDAHRQKGGSGAVGDITQMPSGKVVTGGADGHVAEVGPRRG